MESESNMHISSKNSLLGKNWWNVVKESTLIDYLFKTAASYCDKLYLYKSFQTYDISLSGY